MRSSVFILLKVLLWIARPSAQWRLLRKRYGNWNSVYKRFHRWSEQGLGQERFEHFAEGADMEKLMLDSKVIRVHACSGGGPKDKRGQEAQALGYSRGGLRSKIHINVDTLGHHLISCREQGKRIKPPKPRRYLKATERSSFLATRHIALETRFGFPVDLECAYQGDTLFLLQCRPVTAF